MADRERAYAGHLEVEHGDAVGDLVRTAARPAPDLYAAESSPILRGEELDQAVMRSLILAAKDAHLVAYRTGTGVVTRRNGKVAVVAPDPAMYEDLIPPPFQESRQP